MSISGWWLVSYYTDIHCQKPYAVSLACRIKRCRHCRIIIIIIIKCNQLTPLIIIIKIIIIQKFTTMWRLSMLHITSEIAVRLEGQRSKVKVSILFTCMSLRPVNQEQKARYSKWAFEVKVELARHHRAQTGNVW